MNDAPEAKADADERTSFFKVSGLDCGSCAMKIETALGKIPGVASVDAAIGTETVSVRHGGKVSMAMLATKLDALGYAVVTMAQRRDALIRSDQHAGDDTHGDHDHSPTSPHDHDHGRDDIPLWRSHEALQVFACVILIALAHLTGLASPALKTAFLIASALAGLIPVAIKAWRGLRQGYPFSIETLLVVAAIGAIVLQAYEEAAVVVILFMIGEMLEGLASGNARRGIRGLVELLPQTAFVERNGAMVEESIAALTVGTTIIVRPGDRISADGEIMSGISSIDDSPVTGESAPKTKQPGNTVYAGSINHDAVLRIRVTADTASNTITRIARMVEEAQDRKSPTQRFINRFSSIYTPFVFGIGALTALVPPLLFGADWTTWIYRGLAVLLIGCPCALVISTPAAIASSIAAAARRGLLIKGGEVLERLADITMVALDKTGTLTTGVPSVTDLKSFGMAENDMLASAAAVETGSSHPLAKAILAIAATQNLALPPVELAQVVLGKGVTGTVGGQTIFVGSPKQAAETARFSAEQQAFVDGLYNQGKSVAVVVANDSVTGIIGLRDEPKADARDGIKALAKNNIKALMLTGDNHATAEAIAASLGIEAHSELLPEDKMRFVADLQKQGEVVAKVGDGINDAPALAKANIGIAMAGGPGGGTDIALETGDVAILGGRVGDIATLITLARRTMRNIHQNLAIAIGLKVLFLITTLVGITGLWPAILADTGATLLVTANALRLLRAP